MAQLNMKFWDFYDLTPIEIDYALKAHIKEIEDQVKLSWEQTRTQIYYNYLLTPSRKRKVSYSTFKKDYLKFNFDDDDKGEKDIIDDATFETIQEIFKNKTKGTQS